MKSITKYSQNIYFRIFRIQHQRKAYTNEELSRWIRILDAIINHITKKNLYTRMKRHIEQWGGESQIGGIFYFTNPVRGINER